MHVRTIIQSKGDRVEVIQPSESLHIAVKLMRSAGVGALVVSPDGTAIDGIISERDIVRRLATVGPDALGEPVSGAMTREVVTCQLDDPVEALMALMTERRIRHLPVAVDGALSGIVSIGDVVKARLTQLENENRALADYVSNPSY